MNMADYAVRIKADRDNIPEYWYDASGHVIVIGEAAHSSLVSKHQ